MLNQLESNFNSIFSVGSHTLVAEQGATSYFNSGYEEDEDEEEHVLEEEDEEYLEELDFED